MLTEWLRLNAQAAESGEEPPPMYPLMPSAYTWKETWNPRRRGPSASIGRMPYISPTAGDVHYLRAILLQPVSRGAVSFKALRTVDGVVGRFSKRARPRLMQDDRQWQETMAAAAGTDARRLRGTFVIV